MVRQYERTVQISLPYLQLVTIKWRLRFVASNRKKNFTVYSNNPNFGVEYIETKIETENLLMLDPVEDDVEIEMTDSKSDAYAVIG
uniref:Uncharacterized protein n=1 Tax=Strigamia maritima TaxID=126957 RepID=T1JEN4_STRMM